MSPSNRGSASGPRRRRLSLPGLSAAALLVLSTLFLGGSAGFAQNSPDRSEIAVLVSGPSPVNGLPLSLPNAIPALKGGYEISGEVFEVFYTAREVLLPEVAGTTGCGGFPMRRYELKDALVRVYQGEGWMLFFRFPDSQVAEAEKGSFCRFFPEFLKEFRYFLSFAGSQENVSFPAIVEPEA
ncbi:MAG: hypothetical protein K9L68_13320 [Spirochaetales bacterium]|nr:hypothetical protein [Spirochaetales bacterium]MCF7939573.1 hypothetical protein [Spirochaetales bacterium]